MRRNSPLPLLAGLALGVLASVAHAQPDLEGFWATRLERERSGQALIDELPAGVVLINDTGDAGLRLAAYLVDNQLV